MTGGNSNSNSSQSSSGGATPAASAEMLQQASAPTQSQLIKKCALISIQNKISIPTKFTRSTGSFYPKYQLLPAPNTESTATRKITTTTNTSQTANRHKRQQQQQLRQQLQLKQKQEQKEANKLKLRFNKIKSDNSKSKTTATTTTIPNAQHTFYNCNTTTNNSYNNNNNNNNNNNYYNNNTNNYNDNIDAQAQEQELQQQQQQQHEQQQQQLLLQNPTKQNFLLKLDLLAVVRRNASDKLKLIEMVHNNPILWDSRLPNFKGAEQEKNLAWEHIGREFNAPGRRVARAFKSLRESYRRELAHVKIMGNGFKPKWTLYEAMDFLRDVIRERKGGSHASDVVSSAAAAAGMNLNMNGAYGAGNAAATHHKNSSGSGSSSNKHSSKLNSVHSALSDSALNLSKCSSHMSHEDFFYAFAKPELQLVMQQQHHQQQQQQNLNVNANVVNTPQQQQQQQQQQQMQLQPLPAHLQSQQQHALQLQQQLKREFNAAAAATTAVSQNNDSRVSSTRNDSNAQHSNFDDTEMRSGDEASIANVALSHQDSDEVEELEAIDADFPYPLILDSNSSPINSAESVVNSASASVIKRKHKELLGGNSANGDGLDDDEDDYENQMLQQQRHLRQQNGHLNFMNGLAGLGAGMPTGGVFMDMPQPQTVREVLNSKFCSFITAKLNSMQDTEADNLITKILMLLVQTQTPPTDTKL